MNVQVQER